MGYTHYWKNTYPLTVNQWSDLLKTTTDIIVRSNVPVSLKSSFFMSPPFDNQSSMRSQSHITIDGFKNDAYETFYLTPQAVEWDCCKTAQRPYDTIVVAILNHAAARIPGFYWSSDGKKHEHLAGLHLQDNEYCISENLREVG
tara:strand:- start:288 stop:716 length:429 start_codon:yes stop_codon:yes gene_type:complete